MAVALFRRFAGAPLRGRFAGGVVTALMLASAPAAAQRTPPADTSQVAPDTVFRPPVSPGGAFLRSLVLPGWGQSLLGSPGRGAVYFALESGSLWMVYKSRQRLGSARDEQDALREAGVLGPDQELSLVGSRQQQVQDWVTLSAFWLLFSAADAYVGAYLSGFNERINARPTAGGGLELRAEVPVGGGP